MRPILVTIFCVLQAVGLGIMCLLLAIPAVREVASEQAGHRFFGISWYLNAALFVAALVGYWKMRRLGVYLYAVAIVVSFGSAYLMNLPVGILSYVTPILGLAIGLVFFKRMV